MTLGARNLQVDLGGRTVLDGIDLNVVPGEVLGLLGTNGAGKSTLIRALAAQVPFSGTVRLDDRDVAAMTPLARGRLIAHLPQARVIGWPMPVREVVALGRLPWQGFGRRATDADRTAVAAAMALTDVAHLADRNATELSGGEQARVLTARAIAQTTPVLLADEPASGLDPAHRIAALEAMRALAREGKSVLVSMHDLTLAARWCDRLVVLSGGHIAASGAPADVLTAATLEDLFGVRAHIVQDSEGLIVAPTGLGLFHGKEPF